MEGDFHGFSHHPSSSPSDDESDYSDFGSSSKLKKRKRNSVLRHKKKSGSNSSISSKKKRGGSFIDDYEPPAELRFSSRDRRGGLPNYNEAEQDALLDEELMESDQEWYYVEPEEEGVYASVI